MVPEYTVQDFRAQLRLFRIGELLSSRRVARGPDVEVFRLVTTQGDYFARMVRDWSIKDARFEEAVLAHVGDRGLAVPRMITAGARGGVLELGARTQLSVFQSIGGRIAAAFEVDSENIQAVGRYLAQLHGSSRGLRRRRRHSHEPEYTALLLRRGLKHAGLTRELAQDLARDPTRELGTYAEELELLCQETARHKWSRQLPQAIIHGGLGRENVRFEKKRIVAGLGFRDSGTGPMAYDLAMCIALWAFPMDAFDADLAHDLVSGYQSLRPLSLFERESLFDLCCYATARVAVARFGTHEVGESWAQERGIFRDFRHFIKRLQALQAFGAERFRSAVADGANGSITNGFGATL